MGGRTGPLLRLVLLAWVALGLTACATGYQSEGLAGGFDEKELESGIWRISFGGNGFTSGETAQTYWLYRCAELTLQKGYDGFEILSDLRLLMRKRQGRGVQVASSAPVYVPVYYGDANKPFVEGDIRLLKKPFEPAPPKRFDAARLKAALEPYVTGNKCGSYGNVCAHVHRYLFPESEKGTSN